MTCVLYIESHSVPVEPMRGWWVSGCVSELVVEFVGLLDGDAFHVELMRGKMPSPSQVPQRFLRDGFIEMTSVLQIESDAFHVEPDEGEKAKSRSSSYMT